MRAIDLPTINPRQNGTVLIVSLIFLLIMTLLGLAASGSANMELRMAGNNERINTTLQAAESAVEATINNIDLLGQALNSSTGISASVRLDSAFDAADQPVRSEAEISYIGQGGVEGYSMGVNQSNFVAHNFEVVGTGSMQDNVTSITSQGVYRVAPSGG